MNNNTQQAEQLAVLQLRRDIAADEREALDTQLSQLNDRWNAMSLQLADNHSRGVVDEHLEAEWESNAARTHAVRDRRNEAAREASELSDQIQQAERSLRRRGPELEL